MVEPAGRGHVGHEVARVLGGDDARGELEVGDHQLIADPQGRDVGLDAGRQIARLGLDREGERVLLEQTAVAHTDRLPGQVDRHLGRLLRPRPGEDLEQDLESAGLEGNSRQEALPEAEEARHRVAYRREGAGEQGPGL